MELNRRRGNRTKAVLPVKIKGTDKTGQVFEDLVHTLDVTAAGLRLGSVHRDLNVSDEISVFYRARKIQYRVVWTRRLEKTSEFQVGLQAVTQEREAWGLSLAENQPVSQFYVSQESGVA